MEAGAGAGEGLNGSNPEHRGLPADQANTATAHGDVGWCPLLGFVDDPIRHYSRPSFLHRCYSRGRGDPVSSATQSELCLASDHTRCERFLEASTRTAAHAIERVRADYAPSPLFQPVAETVAVANGAADLAADLAEVAPAPQAAPKRTGTVWLVRGVLVAMLALLAVLVVAVESGPTVPPVLRVDLSTPRAAATAAATLPVPAADAPAAEAPPTAAAGVSAATAVPTLIASQSLDVHFDTRQADWPENPPYVSWSAGAYRLDARDQERFVAVAAPIPDVPADVEVRALFQKTGGPAGGGYGIILRDQRTTALDGAEQAGAYYVLEFGDRGEVGAWRRDEDRWIELVPWTRAGVDTPANAVTDVRARATGDVLTLVVDGSQVLQVEDRTLSSGGVGVFVGGDGNQVALLALTVTPAD